MFFSSEGRTLRRGGAILGRAVGNFFGVTEESQHGTANTIGWEEVSERRVEVREALEDRGEWRVGGVECRGEWRVEVRVLVLHLLIATCMYVACECTPFTSGPYEVTRMCMCAQVLTINYNYLWLLCFQ